MVAAVIFDMDGTLLDSEAVSQAVWDEVLRSHGIEDSLALRRGFIGRSVAINASKLYEIFGSEEEVRQAYRERDELFTKKSKTDLTVKPGAFEAIGALRKDGYAIGLATGTHRAQAMERLEMFGFPPLFDSMTFGDDLPGKPAPDIFLKASEDVGASPAECVVVEDSPNGVLSAHAAGMRVLMIPDLIEPTDDITALCETVLDSLFEVEDAVSRL